MAGTSKRGLSASKSRSSGLKGGKASSRRTPPTNTKAAPGPKLPYEKSVRSTGKTVGVGPPLQSSVSPRITRVTPRAKRSDASDLHP